jgi:hypothetical protein
LIVHVRASSLIIISRICCVTHVAFVWKRRVMFASRPTSRVEPTCATTGKAWLVHICDRCYTALPQIPHSKQALWADTRVFDKAAPAVTIAAVVAHNAAGETVTVILDVKAEVLKGFANLQAQLDALEQRLTQLTNQRACEATNQAAAIHYTVNYMHHMLLVPEGQRPGGYSGWMAGGSTGEQDLHSISLRMHHAHASAVHSQKADLHKIDSCGWVVGRHNSL